jgi:hypothetical protein
MVQSLKFRSIIIIVSLVFMLVVACKLTGQTAEVLPPTQSLPTETMLPSATVPIPATPTATPTAIPVAIQDGPTLGDSTDSIAAFYHCPKVLEALAINTPIREDPYTVNPSTTTYAIKVSRPDQKLLWRIGWCAKTKETLTENLKSIEFSAKLNDQVVDLKNTLADVYTYENAFCYYHLIVAYNWPEKTTVFESIVNISTLINNDFYDYDAGKVFIYRYEVTGSGAIASATSQAEGVATDFPPIEGMPALMSQADTAKELALPEFAFLEDVADRSKFPVERHQVVRYFDGENIFVLRPPSRQKHLVWATGWCAADQATLDQNLENISFEMSIYNTPIDIGQFYSSDFQASGSSDYCRMYSLVAYDWPSGNTSLISKTVLNKSINNGHKTYPASEITRTYTVITP